MALGDLVDTVILTINSQPEAYWGNIKIPRDMQAVPVLDPDVIYDSENRMLFISPIYTPINLAESNKRGPTIQSLSVDYVYTSNIFVPFRTFGKQDVGSWQEIKDILDLRERLDYLIAKNTPTGYSLLEFNQEPPVEINLKERVFLASTEVILRKQRC